jgi:hypothetical protein
MHGQTKPSTGYGYLICAICSVPLAYHVEIFAHDLPELALQRIRSSGMPDEEEFPPHLHGLDSQPCACGFHNSVRDSTGISSLTG